jgi:hypothetical protein
MMPLARITLAFDSDVVDRLQDEVRRLGRDLKAVVNDA